MIYLDNAATSQKKPKEVLEAVLHAMESMGNAGRSTHEAAHSSTKTVFDTRVLLTEFFHLYEKLYGKLKHGDSGQFKAGRPCDYHGDGA